MTTPHPALDKLLERAGIHHFKQALSQYRLVPPGSVNGYPERNLTNALALALGWMQGSADHAQVYKEWAMLVEVPFCDLSKLQKKKPGLTFAEARLNARLDALLMTPETWYLIECKQFYQQWKVNDKDYGLAADLARLQHPDALASLFDGGRLLARPPERLVAVALLDCWRSNHREFLCGKGERRGWDQCLLAQRGFDLKASPDLGVFTRIDGKPENGFENCDGYWWVWGTKEILRSQAGS